ncbi:preprotein translocase subunit SecG [Dietzia sp.]|uniref:preprotein translocase subunit SecG n=1 Tax=Dietzia sp. TaxID=1871616 RepID=UPI002FDAFCFE
MKLALEILLVLSSIILMILVLMHRGKGGGLSSLFGGGMQSSLSGSSVVERNLDIYTVAVGLVWLALILVFGLGVSFQWF